MGAIVVEQTRLQLVPADGSWQEALVPVQDGDPGQLGAAVLDTAHAGYGDSRGVLPGHYEYAVDVDATRPQLITAAPARTDIAVGGTEDVSGFFDAGGYTYVLAGQYVKRIDPATNSVTTSLDLGAGNVAKSGVAWKGKGYVAAGSTLREMTPPDTWASAAIAADVLAVGLSALYKASGAAVAKNANNPMTPADWSAGTTFGDSSVPVTAMAEYGRFLLVGKHDSLWALDANFEAANVLPDIAAWRSADNCRSLTAWHGMLVVPHRQGLYFYAPGEVTPAGPERLELNESPVRGQVLAVAGAGMWLYISLWTGTDTYILAGRERDAATGGLGPMLWHPILKLPGVRCRALFVSGLTNPPRLYMGRGSNVSFIPVLESSLEAARAPTGTIYWQISGRRPMALKLWSAIELMVDGPRQGASVRVAVSVDGGPWTYVGEAAAPGYARFALPPTAEMLGYRLGLHIELVGGARVNMPITVSYVASPRLVRAFTATVLLGGDTRAAQQEATFAWLRSLTEAGPVRLEGPQGQVATVKIVDVRRASVGSPSTGYAVALTAREVA